MTTNPPGRRTATAAVLVAVLTLAASACGSDDTSPTPTTAAPDTTGTTAATVTTTPVTTARATTSPDVSSLAAGSGCTPGTAAALPAGEWFGYVDAAAAGEVRFDLACWFTGEAAARAATDDGEESPPPNDFYVRNVNDAARSLGVAPGASVTWLPNPGDPATEQTITYGDWLDVRDTRGYQPGVWLTIDGGAVVELHEQYVP